MPHRGFGSDIISASKTHVFCFFFIRVSTLSTYRRFQHPVLTVNLPRILPFFTPLTFGRLRLRHALGRLYSLIEFFENPVQVRR